MSLNKFETVGNIFSQTQSALTDSSGGTAATQLVAVDSTYDSDTTAGINNNFASVAARLAEIKVDVADLMNKLNAAN